jgi:PadR family transcriptional regulator
MSEPRMTETVVAILTEILKAGQTPLYGLDAAHRAQIRPGSAYPVLQRLEAAGWLEASWEDAEAAAVGRPVRRYYRLTPMGAREAPPLLECALRERGVSRRPTRSWGPVCSWARR